MQTRHFVYLVEGTDRKRRFFREMDSLDEFYKESAIFCLWQDVLWVEYADDDFNGVAVLYDTVKREGVYYFSGDMMENCGGDNGTVS